MISAGDNSELSATDIISSVEDVCGVGTVYACVHKPGNVYEVVLADSESVRCVRDGLTVGERTVNVREFIQSSVVVSFLKMSPLVKDSQIVDRLIELGVEVIGDIHWRVHRGTQASDGTRYVRVRFPQTLKSLPYSMKFFNGKVNEYVRVLHNDQIKVCSGCYSDEHLYKNCPEFKCHKCGMQGHTRRQCTAQLCHACGYFQCVCVRCDRCENLNCECSNVDDGENVSDTKEIICFKCGRQGHVARLCKEPKCAGCDKFGLNCVCDNQTLEDCEHCGKCACQCEDTACSFCERPVSECNCGPDDICKFCCVEIRDCQCLVCDSCGKRDCWCNANTSTADNVQRPPDPTSNQSGVADNPVAEHDPPVSDTQSTGPTSTSSTCSTSSVSGDQPQSSPKPAGDNDSTNTKLMKAKQKHLKQMTYASKAGGRNSNDRPILRPSLVNSKSNFELCVIGVKDGKCLVTRRRKNVTNESSIPVSKRSNRENNVEMI